MKQDTYHIIMHFRYGGVEAGLFVLLTTLNKQLEFEQTADIYMFAKLLYMKRPGVFRSKVNHKVTIRLSFILQYWKFEMHARYNQNQILFSRIIHIHRRIMYYCINVWNPCCRWKDERNLTYMPWRMDTLHLWMTQMKSGRPHRFSICR